MSMATGYSLWLTPGKETVSHAILSELIVMLSKEHNTPRFNPHVTLLGTILEKEKHIKLKVQKIAQQITPFDIRFNAIGANGTYFQMLFLEAVRTNPLRQAHAIACEVLDRTKERYFPHLSLAYGYLAKSQVACLKTLVRGAGFPEIAFKAEKIELWQAEGTVDQWSCVEVFPFGNV